LSDTFIYDSADHNPCISNGIKEKMKRGSQNGKKERIEQEKRKEEKLLSDLA
jgi:phosphomannomutase